VREGEGREEKMGGEKGRKERTAGRGEGEGWDGNGRGTLQRLSSTLEAVVFVPEPIDAFPALSRHHRGVVCPLPLRQRAYLIIRQKK
jgi:hypothetical protein